MNNYKEFTSQEKDTVNTDKTTTTLTDFSESNVGDRVDPVAEKQVGAESKLVPPGSTGTKNDQKKGKTTQSAEAVSYQLKTVSDENTKEKIQKKMRARSMKTIGTEKLPMKKRMHANSEPPVMIENVKQITPTGTGIEKLLISPQTMLENHVLRGDAIVRISPCAAIMSGIKQCGKTTATEKILGSRNAYGPIPITPLLDQSREGSNKCLSHYKLIVVGEEPYEDDLSWIITPHNIDVAALFLLSYFVKVCKIRDDNNYEKLEFTQGPASTFFPDSTLNDQVNALHERVASLWEEFKKDKKGTSEETSKNKKGILNVLPAGVSLINIFDVGPSKAAQDFVPFLNKYCKRSMLLTCYSDTNDARHLKEELTKNSTTCTGTKSNQLLRQLKGCLNEEQTVIIMKLINESIPLPHSFVGEKDQVKEAIKANVDAQNVEHLVISNDKLAEAATTMERTIVKGPFHLAVYLREILLLQTIRMNTDSFWVKKNHVEKLSAQLKFMNGSVDRFLKIFTTFGSIFYTHDIPALDEYVIVNITGFVEHLDQLYCSSEQNKLFRYGLFQYDDSKDKEVIFKFLTVLGIAVKVSSTQLELPQVELTHPHYCYIPMARQTPSPHNDNLPLESSMQDDSIVISFDRCIAENLQACLCYEVLLKGGRLIPTDNPNTTVVQVSGSNTPIEITDFGKDVRITVKQNGTSAKRILSCMLIAFPCLKTKSGAILHYQVTKVSESFINKDSFIENLQTTKCESLCIKSSNLGLAMMVNIAEQLSEMHSDNMDKLYSAFKITQETSCRPEMTILQMMLDFFNRSKNKDFNDTLIHLGISPKKLE